jgi:bacillithiol system protein YtxJ
MTFSFFSKASKEEQIPSLWKELNSLEGLNDIFEASKEKPQLIFKHSTRCGISRVVLRQFESQWKYSSEGVMYFLDLIQYRQVSNEIAERTGVTHQSPQAIVIYKEKAIANASHQAISAEMIAEKMT